MFISMWHVEQKHLHNMDALAEVKQGEISL